MSLTIFYEFAPWFCSSELVPIRGGARTGVCPSSARLMFPRGRRAGQYLIFSFAWRHSLV